MTIARIALDTVLAHARESQPRECCGMLIGRGDEIVTAVPAGNLAEGASRFLIDPKDHIDARRAARERGLNVLGFYHSHPRSDAFPSATDLSEAEYPECVHLIVGMRSGADEARFFRFSGGEVTEEELTIR